MCGRFYLDVTFEELLTRYDLRQLDSFYEASTEVFPTQMVGMIPQGAARVYEPVLWGIQQPFLKKPLINGRSETLFEKTLFKSLIYTNKCLIPACGYFEWKQLERNKQKYKIVSNEEKIFSMAGLFGIYQYKGEFRKMCVILTKDAIGPLSEIHPRMPVILTRDTERKYLEAETTDAINKSIRESIFNMQLELC